MSSIEFIFSSRTKLKWILILILPAVFSINISAQKKLFIENGKEAYSIGRYVSVLEDKENKLSINDAASDSLRNKFVFLNKETLNFRFSSSVFWLKLEIVDTLHNPEDKIKRAGYRNWLLIKNDPVLEDVRLYYRDFNSNGQENFTEIKGGSVVPLENKAVQTNEFVANFPVRKDTLNTFYIRVQTISQVIISFDILTTEQYIIHSTKKFYFHGILFGILLLLIGYNSLLYFSLRENTYLFYVLYLLFYSFFLFVYEGYYFEFIGRTFRHDYFILTMAAISATVMFWLLLTRDFLSTKTFAPLAYKILNYLAVIGPLSMLITFFAGSITMFIIWSSCNFAFFISGLVIAVVTLKRGNKISIFYIIGLSGMAAGIFILLATRNNYFSLSLNFWTQNALHFGILWEAIILAYTVGYRFNLLKLEKEKEKELIRNQIAADLHDEVASNLSTISLQSQMMLRTLKLDDSSKKQLLDIADMAGFTTETIRDIVWFINPFHDKSQDLVIRMKELASKMLINSEYTFNVGPAAGQIFDVLPDLRKRRHIYLIFKEVLNNINKHAQAEKVNIFISLNDKNFVMSIRDNGKGFNENDTFRGEGLKNLRNRAALMGTEILIESEAGKGTKVTLKVPL